MVVSKVIRFSEVGNYGMVAGHRGNGADGAVDPASPDPDGVFVPAP